MTGKPDRLFCWNFQTEEGAWEKGWGGYARPQNLAPLDNKERVTGAVYVREDICNGLLEALRELTRTCKPSCPDGVDAIHNARVLIAKADGWT
jgi:hypothetical protein